jgi:hypothetical protein
VGKPEGERPLGRPRRRWVDNIKMDLLEIGMDWIVESSCECGYELLGSINGAKLSSGYIIGGLSSSSQFYGVSRF